MTAAAAAALPAYRPPVEVLDELLRLRRSMVASGLDAVHDDARSPLGWFSALDAEMDLLSHAMEADLGAGDPVAWRRSWLRITALSLSALESIQRKARTGAPA